MSSENPSEAQEFSRLSRASPAAGPMYRFVSKTPAGHRRVLHIVLLSLGLCLFGPPLSGGLRPCLAEGSASASDSHENEGGQASAGKSCTSLKRFPKDLCEDFLALFASRNVKPLLLGSAVTGGLAIFDDEIHDHFQNRNHYTAFTEIGDFMGKAYVLTPAIGGLLLAGQYSRSGGFRSFSCELAKGYVLNNALTGAIKFSVGRERPDAENNRSFPSGHASNYFMIATVVERHYGLKAGIAGYAVAAGVAISRVAKDEHWASDVAAGATLGWIVGRTVSRKQGLTGRITTYPALDHQNKAVGLCLVLRLP
jgi:membrane-associated phospholipid phosphatase